MSNLNNIQKCFRSGEVLYSRHAREEMIHEEFGRIYEQEVYEAICTGEVIEEYPDDAPYPSSLIYRTTKTGRLIHTLAAYDAQGDLTIIITVYQPNPSLWDDFKRRKR